MWRQPIRMRPGALGVESVLPGTSRRLFPIPPEQHGFLNSTGIHVAQQLADRGEGLDRLPSPTPAGAQRRPVRLTLRSRPRRRIAPHLRRVQMNMSVDDAHAAVSFWLEA